MKGSISVLELRGPKIDQSKNLITGCRSVVDLRQKSSRMYFAKKL